MTSNVKHGYRFAVIPEEHAERHVENLLALAATIYRQVNPIDPEDDSTTSNGFLHAAETAWFQAWTRP